MLVAYHLNSDRRNGKNVHLSLGKHYDALQAAEVIYPSDHISKATENMTHLHLLKGSP